MITSNLPTVATVEFHGAQLITIKKDDHEFVAMKPVVEGIGLDWKTQRRKLMSYGHMTPTEKVNRGHMTPVDKFNCGFMPIVAADGKKRDVLCMPITKLNGWLFSINPNKISTLKTRENVVKYQEECFVALYNYWHKGIAEKKVEQLLPETITPAEQHELSAAVQAKAATTENRVKALAEIWSRVKNKFKVAKYDQLPREMIQEALKYVEDMEIKGVRLLAPPVDYVQEGMLNIKIETLKTKIAIDEKYIESLKAENELFKELYKSAREQVKDAFGLIRDLVKR